MNITKLLGRIFRVMVYIFLLWPFSHSNLHSVQRYEPGGLSAKRIYSGMV